jgi:hypothetical protein
MPHHTLVARVGRDGQASTKRPDTLGHGKRCGGLGNDSVLNSGSHVFGYCAQSTPRRAGLLARCSAPIRGTVKGWAQRRGRRGLIWLGAVLATLLVVGIVAWLVTAARLRSEIEAGLAQSVRCTGTTILTRRPMPGERPIPLVVLAPGMRCTVRLRVTNHGFLRYASRPRRSTYSAATPVPGRGPGAIEYQDDVPHVTISALWQSGTTSGVGTLAWRGTRRQLRRPLTSAI